jgi:hypothetical protein
MAPDIPGRYQRAADVLDAVLAARARPAAAPGQRRQAPADVAEKRPWRPAPLDAPGAAESVDDIQARLKAREAPQARFCWHCRKPLHARTDKCPFCGEAQ